MYGILRFSWTRILRDHRFRTIFFFGVASGLPSSLVFGTLSIWLREEGLTRTSIGLIGLAATPYAINFLWAPLVDRLPLGPLTVSFGQRRSWIMACQLALAPSVVIMGYQAPQMTPLVLGLAALLVAFFSATQDVAIDAYRVEVLKPEEFGTGAALAIYGWHVGAFITGAGALYVAAFGGWAAAYGVAGVLVGFMAVTTLIAREPERPASATTPTKSISQWLRHAAIAPLTDFFKRLGWLSVLVLGVIVFYKFGDAMVGRMSGVLYVDLGFNKIEIANYSKSIGLFATLLGVGVGGWFCSRLGIVRAMFFGATLMMVTNLAFALLASVGRDFEVLAAVVFFDNLSGGMATTAFVAYLSSLCNVVFTATQYALLASLGNFARIQLGSVSGWFVDSVGGNWALFFVTVAGMSIPAILLLWAFVQRLQKLKKN